MKVRQKFSVVHAKAMAAKTETPAYTVSCSALSIGGLKP